MMARPPPLRTLAVLAALAVLPRCACDTVPSGAITQCNAVQVGIGAVQTDILFVVDDSGSMAVEQTNIASNFSAFIQQLSSSPVRNDFQIGITTTSVDRNSAASPPGQVTFFATGPNQNLPYPAGALVRVDATTGMQITTGPGRILPASSPTLVNDFVQNVHVGTLGSGKEQPLRAARYALSEPLLSGANAGFLRPGARLAVVFVTDDDDCSDPGDGSGNAIVPNAAEGTNCETYAEAASDFVTFLQGTIAGENRNTLVGMIASFDPVTLDPAVCNVPQGGTSEYQALRLKAFANAFGANAIQASICSPSFHDALQAIAVQLVPQTFPLEGTPADWRLLAVQLVRNGVAQGCPVALAGTAGAATAGAVYTPSVTGGAPTLTMQGNCTLAAGDSVEIHIVCAG